MKRERERLTPRSRPNARRPQSSTGWGLLAKLSSVKLSTSRAQSRPILPSGRPLRSWRPCSRAPCNCTGPPRSCSTSANALFRGQRKCYYNEIQSQLRTLAKRTEYFEKSSSTKRNLKRVEGFLIGWYKNRHFVFSFFFFFSRLANCHYSELYSCETNLKRNTKKKKK